MAKALASSVFDGTLAQIRSHCDLLTVCSQQPTTYTEATVTYKLADVSMTINTDYTLADGDPDGRTLTVAAKSGVAIDSSGTATHIALCKTSGSELRAVTTCTSQALTAGGTLDIPAWVISTKISRIGPLTVSSRNVVDASGNPVLLMGDAGWSMIVQLSTADMDTYLADRQSRGFNAVLVELIEHQFGAHSPNNIDNVAPFTSTTFTTPNEPYFIRADYAVHKALNLGLYVLLAPLYLGFSGTEEGWDSEVTAASTGDMASWGTYVGNRYKGFENIIWVLGGDRDPTTFLTKINAFANALVAADPNHLVTFHDDRGGQGSDHLAGASWYTLNDTYSTYLATPTLANSAYTNSPTLPFFQIEAYYENEHSMTAQNLRAQAYWTILGGGVGHVFGNSPIWNFDYNGANGGWTQFLDDAGSVSMTYCASLMRSKAWSSMAPDSSHALVTSGYGTIGNADFCGAAIDGGGHLAMIYMPSNRTMAVDMSKFAGTVTARWYDPTNGSYTADAASPLSNAGSHSFSRAAANSAGAADWVLVMEAA